MFQIIVMVIIFTTSSTADTANIFSANSLKK